MKRFCTVLFSAAVLLAAVLSASCSDVSSASQGGGDTAQVPGGGDTSGAELSAPTGLYATAASSSSVKLTWNSVSDATEYLIYKSKNSSNSSASFVGSTALTSKTVTGLEADTKYYFWVKAANSTTTSDFSSSEYVTTTGKTSSSGSDSGTTTTLSAPTGLYATAASSSSVRLTWNSVRGATEYLIYKSKNSSNASASFVGSTTLTSKTVTGLEANTKYYFWVKATNSTTTSSYSIFVYATTEAASSSGGSSSGTTVTTLSAPTGVTAFEDSSSRIRLSWNSVKGATEYEVYCSTFSSPYYASLYTTTTSTSTIISGNNANTTYYFWVKAINGTTKSNWSSYDHVTTKGSSSSQSKGTLKVINNSSYAIKNVQMYTTYEVSFADVFLDGIIDFGDSKTFTNITPGTYVRLGSETYRSHKVSTYKTVTVNSGSTTTLTITNSDIISN